MAELCLSTSTTFKPHFPSFIYSHFSQFSAFILSNPIYFLYFIFFSPYLLKLLSFLSPLFLTTSLLFLLALSLVHNTSTPKLSEPGPASHEAGFDEHYILEESEAYKTVFLFHPQLSDVVEHHDQEDVKPAGEVHQTEVTDLQTMEDKRLQDFLKVFDDKRIDLVSTMSIKTDITDLQLIEETKPQDFIRVLDDSEDNVDEKRIDPLSTEPVKVVVKNVEESIKAKVVINTSSGCDNGGEYTKKVILRPRAKSHCQNSTVDNGGEYTSNLGSYGSMRKEKEWRRTLACKLFEERHNAAGEGVEGIDALWETYESEDLSNSMRMATATTKQKKNIKGTPMKYYGYEEDDIEEDEEEEEEELEIRNVQLCCLQAFKFSARKMNLGMGRPNLVKFSKAIKGIGWLHHVKRNVKKEKY